MEADQGRHAKAKAEAAANEARDWREWLRPALEEIRVNHFGLRVDDCDGPLDDAYGADEKPTPSIRDVRLHDVDERFPGRLTNMARCTNP